MTTMFRMVAQYVLPVMLFTATPQYGMLAAQQLATDTATAGSILDLASQGQFDSADQVMESQLASQQPDYDLFWEYLSFLHNQANEHARAARLGRKWLSVARKEKPQALGRILKETAIAILLGSFKERHSLDDFVAAKGLLEEAVDVNPRVMEAYLHLAMIASLEGQAAASLALMDRAVESTTDYSQYEALSALRDRARKEDGYLLTIAQGMYSIGP